jgi:hypothetical protein
VNLNLAGIELLEIERLEKQFPELMLARLFRNLFAPARTALELNAAQRAQWLNRLRGLAREPELTKFPTQEQLPFTGGVNESHN